MRRQTVREQLTCMLILILILGWAFDVSAPGQLADRAREDLLTVEGDVGRRGGRLLASLHSDPKTLNPFTALDTSSKQVLALLFADLIHINAYTQHTEPALAKSWKASSNGTHYTLELRRGLRFSDGQSFDADDVVFSFQVYLDDKLHSPQRDLLLVGGKTDPNSQERSLPGRIRLASALRGRGTVV